MRDIKAIKRLVTRTLSEKFINLKISDVFVREDSDASGDDVLRIDVVFAGTPTDLDTSMLSGAVRALRPKLDAMQEYAFPLLSFISQAELDNKAPKKRASA